MRMLGRHAGRGRRVIDGGEPARVSSHRPRGIRCRPRPGRRRAASRLPAPACRHGPCRAASGRPAPAESPRRRPASRLASRVSTLPRKLTICRSGRRCRSWARRRSAEVPTMAPCLEVGDAPDVARDQHVARILARQEGGDQQAGRLRRRHVLHAVDRGIDALRQQRLLDLLDEQALAAGLGQRPVLDGIARGPDGRRSRWRPAPPAPAPPRPARRAPGRPGSSASLLPRVPSRRRGTAMAPALA